MKPHLVRSGYREITLFSQNITLLRHLIHGGSENAFLYLFVEYSFLFPLIQNFTKKE